MPSSPPPLPPRRRPRTRVPFAPPPPKILTPSGLPLLPPKQRKPVPAARKGSNPIRNHNLIDNHVTVNEKSQKIASLARSCGGAHIKKFSQGSSNIQYGVGHWYKNPLHTPDHKKWGGICKAMAVYWIYCHAKERDFWSWLMDDNGNVQAASASYLINLHASYKGATNPEFRSSSELGLNGDQWVDAIFEVFGLQPAGNINTGKHSKTTSLSSSVAMNAREVATRLVRHSGHYKQFSFRRPGGGHAVALWVGDDVTFFDPNYGEFWFQSKQAFTQWFELFWREIYGARYTSAYYISSWTD